MPKAKAKSKKKSVKKPARKATKTKAKKSAKGVKMTAGVSVGDSLPAFSAEATGGKTVSTADLKGKKTVLYFYPKDSTPGCTLEGHDFTRLQKQFQQAGAEVFGISRDSMKSHEKFKAKECYSIDLLSDEDEQLCKIFGVIKMKNMYGRQVRGIERSTFVIDQSGVLKKEWRGVRVDGHAEEVLEFVRSL